MRRNLLFGLAGLATVGMAWGQTRELTLPPPKPLLKIIEGSVVIATIGPDMQVVLAPDVYPRHAADVYAAGLPDFCHQTADFTFSIQFDLGGGNGFIGIKPSGEVVYDGVSLTEESKAFYQTLADKVKCGAKP